MKLSYKDISMEIICGLFGKSRQGYYQKQQEEARKSLEEKIIVDMVRNERKKMPRLGGRKLYHILQTSFEVQGISIGRDNLLVMFLTRQDE